MEPLLAALAAVLPAATSTSSVDTRRLALVVIRTVSRHSHTLVEQHLPLLAPAVFSCARDPLIPVKLAAEQAFLALFDAVDRDAEVFDEYIAKEGDKLAATAKRSMGDYFKRVALRLAAQARERNEAEGRNAGRVALATDEEEDEREVWSVGRVELADVWSDD